MARRDHSLFPPLIRRPSVALGLLLLLAGCGSTDSSDSSASTTVIAATTTSPTATITVPDPPADDAFPDVIGATATSEGDGAWAFAVTISSPYDSPERYADAWRVLGPDGTEFGRRILTHDHATEQPFTRSQSGIAIPGDVGVVTIQGRDLVNGWGGATFDVELPSP